MGFASGDKVEVCSKEEGFLGSYYEATVIRRVGKGASYVVMYTTLLEDDGSLPLIEEVSADELRPLPPKHNVPIYYPLYADVDAFHNDGWWAGKITGILGGARYVVYFPTTGERLAYSISDLRPHHESVRPRCFLSKKRASLSCAY